MDLGILLGLLRRRWPSMLLCVLVGAAAAAAVTARTPEGYVASARVFVSLPGAETPGEALQGVQVSAQLLQSYAELASSRAVATGARTELGLAESAESLSRRISAEPQPQTLFLTVRASWGDPEGARLLADAATRQLIEAIAELEEGRDPATAVRARVIDEAALPGSPVSPRPRANLALGVIAGLLVGVTVALALDALDRSVSTAGQLTDLLDVPLLAVVPALNGRPATAATSSGTRAGGEGYRSIRTALRFLDTESPLQVVAVLSARAGEGRTTTASNLATVLAQTGEEVVLVDADLRRSGLARALGVDGAVGLTDVLVGSVALDEALQVWDSLHVLPAGTLPPNPSELLGSRGMTTTMAALRHRFRYVIIDGAPVLSVTDGVVAGTHADGVLLVARAGRTSRADLEEAVDRLRGVQVAVLGTVLNDTRGAGAHGTARRPRPRPRRAS